VPELQCAQQISALLFDSINNANLWNMNGARIIVWEDVVLVLN
jgi:hypothetical protein